MVFHSLYQLRSAQFLLRNFLRILRSFSWLNRFD
nr:MAG TPA: hypothetical protein [Caudoviricetes sp.]